MADPSRPDAAYVQMQQRWRQMRDVVEGGVAVHAAGTAYLPALSGHVVGRTLSDEYQRYNQRALFYGATGRTIDGLAGMVFRRPPVVDLPPAAATLRNDVDLLGRSLEEFADAILREDLTTGRVGVLVDHTRVADVDLTPGLVRAAPPTVLRPYLVLYPAERILGIVYETVGGARQPVQVRLLEVHEVPDEADEFETRQVEVVRVLEMFEGVYRQRVFVQEEPATKPPTGAAVRESSGFVETEVVIPALPGGQPMGSIPFWIIGTGAATLPGEIEPPPLLDLSDVNLAHYRQDADYRNALHAAGVPTPVFIGLAPPDEPLKLGSLEGIFIQDTAGDAKFLSYGGEGVAAIKEAMQDLEQMMAMLGARMLQPDRRQVEAAETARIHRMSEVSILGRIAGVISSALTGAVGDMMAWAGILLRQGQGIKLNDDFLPVSAQPQLLAEMMKAWQGGAISHDSLWTWMQESELVNSTRTVEEERDLIDEEQPEEEAEDTELSLEQKRLGVEQQRQAVEGGAPPEREAA